MVDALHHISSIIYFCKYNPTVLNAVSMKLSVQNSLVIISFTKTWCNKDDFHRDLESVIVHFHTSHFYRSL